MKRIKRIHVHWSASGPSTTLATIRRWHVQGNGWKDIGYHRVILHPQAAPKAEMWWDLVKQGRKLDDDLFLEADEIGAHTYGFNSDSVGICVVSGPGNPLHPLQALALMETLKVLCHRFNLKPTDVYGHRDFNATQCPGDEIYALIQDFRSW